MNVKIIKGGRAIAIDEFDIKPMTPGQFLQGILDRRKITTEAFRRASGLDAEEVAGLLGDRVGLERPVTKKIDNALPGVSKLLVRMRESHDFYERYGHIRPSSPIKRALVVARHKLELM